MKRVQVRKAAALMMKKVEKGGEVNRSIGLHLLGMRYLVKVWIQRGGEAENLGLRPSLQWEQAFVR